MWVRSKSLTLGACFRRSSCFALLSAVRTKRADNINLTDCVINWRDDVRLVLVWHCWLWMSLHFCGHTHHFRKSIIQIQTRTIFWPKRLDRDAAGLDPLMDKDLKEKKKKNMSWNFWALASGSVSPDTAGIQAFSVSLPLGAGCWCTFPDAFQATSERSFFFFSGTTLLLSFSVTKRVSGQQTLSEHSFLYAVRTCCLSGTPLDKPCFCA